MAETKYGKYIVTRPKPMEGRPPPSGKPSGELVVYVDDEVIKGAFYLNCALIWDSSDGGSPGESHSHDFDEYIGFFGSNPEKPHDLCAEVEIWLGDEKHILTESCAVFVPRGLAHCPIVFKRVDRPIFYFTTAPRTIYEKE